MTTICVGRETELKRLQQFFERTISGKTQICFIVGEAGSGKTTLVNGFFHIVEKIAPEAIIAYAECDAQVRISDPYLPFREILATLTGDTDTKQARPQTAKNLGKFAETSIETLLELGPDLIGSIIPGGALIARGIKIFSDKSDVVKQLKSRLNTQTGNEMKRTSPLDAGSSTGRRTCRSSRLMSGHKPSFQEIISPRDVDLLSDVSKKKMFPKTLV